jgi:hypothetical protein
LILKRKTDQVFSIIKATELHFFTEYGYVKVLKSEYESPASILNCYKEDKKFQATIKVLNIIK